ncbi:MAG: DUF4351 domain-containing protein [Thermosynechococcaceae cyanobacterium]
MSLLSIKRFCKWENERKGRREGELALVLRLIFHRFGVIASATEAQVRALSLSRLEDLGEALLDFSTISDLEDWLRSHP